MKDDFKPVYKQSIEYYTQRLTELCEKEQRLREKNLKVYQSLQEAKTKKGRLKASERNARYGQLANLNLKISEICEIKEKVRKELEERMNEREREPFADDVPQIFNECVGYCYGKCIYVDNNGDFRYREADETDAESIGETAESTDLLEYLNTLPSSEITMILTYLKEHPDTPEWVIANL